MAGERRPTLDVIIVTWNHGGLVDGALDAIAASRRARFQLTRVTVVDNASTAAFRTRYVEGLRELEVVRHEENAGFAGGCNAGARTSRADILLFLNPDTRLAPDAIDEAIRALSESDRATAIVGLQLVDLNGEPALTCGRFPTLARIVQHLTGVSRLAPRSCPGLRMTDWDHRGTRHVDYVSAAAMIVRRPVFEALHGFDDRFFLYLEDADFAYRAASRGWRACYAATARCVHLGGWASGRDRAWRLAHSWRSVHVYAWTHFTPARAALATALIVTIGPAGRLLEAMTSRSACGIRDIAAGYARLWGLLARQRSGRREATASWGVANTNRPARG